MLAVIAGGFAPNASNAADCGFKLETQDTAWTFSAAAGATYSRYLYIVNTSSGGMTINISTSCDAFTVNQTTVQLGAGDSTHILITFSPAKTATTTVYCTLKVTKSGSDCSNTLSLIGTITTNSGGHDKVLSLTPTSYNFGPMVAGQDSCHPFYLVNYTGATVTVTGLTLVGDSKDFKISSSSTPSFTIDSGGYYRFEVCYIGDSLITKAFDSLKVTYQYNGANYNDYALLTGYTARPSSTDLVADPHEFTFGSVKVGTDSCRTVTIKNTSNNTVSNFHITGCNSDVFSVTNLSQIKSLVPGESISLTVCFKPSTAGMQASCVWTLNYTDSTTTLNGAVTVYFSGSSPAANTSCISFDLGSAYKDPVVLGASATRTLELINNTNHSITVTGDSLGCEDIHAFTVEQSQFPLTIPAYDSVGLKYVFTPYATTNGNPKQGYASCLLLWLRGDSLNCTYAERGIYGFSLHDSDHHSTDSVVRPLFPTEPRIVAIESFGTQPTKTFYFYNNLGIDVTVNSVSLKDGQYFAVQSTNPATPFLLHPNSQMSVTIVYTATDKAVHHDTLLFTTTHSIVQSGGFELQGVQAATSGVKAEIPSGVSITLAPNPMTSSITATIGGVTSATVEVYDILGTLLTSAPVMNIWRWNATSSTGEHVSNGSYFVRINGVSNDGIPFVTTKRIIVTN